jgi:hypothetical protein
MSFAVVYDLGVNVLQTPVNAKAQTARGLYSVANPELAPIFSG